MKHRAFISVIVLLLLSCSGGKKLAYEDISSAPGWVRQSPTDPLYYHGIGSVMKTGQPDYREKARQSALSDIAGNISVNISVSSVFSQFETDNKISEYYRDNIKTTARNYLEGYELAGSFETKDRYWVYYRLSKSEYERIRSERIASALSGSEGEFRKAMEDLQSGNFTSALGSFVKAVEKIRDFLGDDLQIQVNGEKRSYSSLLFGNLSDAVQSARIEFPVSSLVVARGLKPDPESLEIVVSQLPNRRLANVPLTITCSWTPGRRNELVTDANGMVRFKPGIINSRQRAEMVSAKVNFEMMVREATTDPVVRKILSGLKISEFNLPVTILPTTFDISITGPAGAEESLNEGLKRDVSSVLRSDGFDISGATDHPGFLIVIDNVAGIPTERGGKFVATLRSTFMVKDPAGNRLFLQQAGDITGLGSNPAEATRDAFNALSQRIRISILPAMYRQLFDN